MNPSSCLEKILWAAPPLELKFHWCSLKFHINSRELWLVTGKWQVPCYADILVTTSSKKHGDWVTEKENLKEAPQKMDTGTIAESHWEGCVKGVVMWWTSPFFNKACERDTGDSLKATGLLFINTSFSAFGTFVKIAFSCHFEIKYSNSLCLDREKWQLVMCVICWEAVVTGDWIHIFCYGNGENMFKYLHETTIKSHQLKQYEWQNSWWKIYSVERSTDLFWFCTEKKTWKPKTLLLLVL